MEEERRDYLRRKLQVGDMKHLPSRVRICVLRPAFRSRHRVARDADCHDVI